MKRKRLCRKCGDMDRCHFCGGHRDSRGWARVFRKTDNGPWHVICPSCAD